MSATYTATLYREDGWWMIQVEGVGLTQARSLDEVDSMARSLVGVMTDTDPESVSVRVVRSGLNLLDELDAARVAKDAATEEWRALARRVAVWAVHELGMTRKDAGVLLGVSHQRVAQLLDEAVRAESSHATQRAS